MNRVTSPYRYKSDSNYQYHPTSGSPQQLLNPNAQIDLYSYPKFINPGSTYGPISPQKVQKRQRSIHTQNKTPLIIYFDIYSLQFPDNKTFQKQKLNQPSTYIKFEYSLYNLEKKELLYHQYTAEYRTENSLSDLNNSVQVKHQKFIDLSKQKVPKISYLLINCQLKEQNQAEFKDYYFACYELFIQRNQQTNSNQFKKIRLKCFDPSDYASNFDFIEEFKSKQLPQAQNNPTLTIKLNYILQEPKKNIFNPNTSSLIQKEDLKLPILKKNQSEIFQNSVQSPKSTQYQPEDTFQKQTNRQLLSKKIQKADAMFNPNTPFFNGPSVQNRQKTISQIAILEANRQIELQKLKATKIFHDKILIQCFSLQNLEQYFLKGEKYLLKIQIHGKKGLLKNPESLEIASKSFQIQNLQDLPYLYLNQSFSDSNFKSYLKEKKQIDRLPSYFILFQIQNTQQQQILKACVPLFNTLGNLNVGNYIKNFSYNQRIRKRHFNDNLSNEPKYKHIQKLSPLIVHFSIQHPGQELEKLGHSFDVKLPQQHQQQQHQQQQHITTLPKYEKNLDGLKQQTEISVLPLTEQEKQTELEDDDLKAEIQGLLLQLSNKGQIHIQLHQVVDFDESQGALVLDFCLTKKNTMIKDRNGKNIEFENDQVFDSDPGDNIVDLNITYHIDHNPNDLKLLYTDHKDLKLLFSFAIEPIDKPGEPKKDEDDDDEDTEEEYGWAAFPLFTEEGQFLYGKFSSPIYQSPISQSEKSDYNNIPKTQSTFIFSVKFTP